MDRRVPALLAAVAITASYYFLLTWNAAAPAPRGAGAGSLRMRIVPFAEPSRPQQRQSSRSVERSITPVTPSPLHGERASTGQPLAPAHDRPADSPAETATVERATPLVLTPSRSDLRAAAGVGSLTRQDIARLAPNDTRSPLERAMDAGSKPDCLSAEALKHEPPQLLGIGVSGLLVAPSWLKAAATGKCKTS